MNSISNSSKVALIKCKDYDLDKVRQAVQRGIGLLGGVTAFAKEGEKILLKPNLLVADRPDKCTTTHPLVFRAVAEVFQRQNLELYYGDSPAIGSMKRLVKQTGIKEIADSLDIRWSNFQEGEMVSFPEALLAKQLYLAKGASAADGIVSIGKMKTHGFTRITGAVKNQFGCIPGLRKAEFHVKMPDVYDFSKVLVDINRFLKPRLYILDGIIAMEGNGPRGGEPFNMKVMLFSTDPVALDAVCCRLIDMNPEYVPTAKIGRDSGLGTYIPEEIEIVGDGLAELKNSEFKAVRRPPDPLAASRSYPNFLKNLISPRPVINQDRCVNCGQCVLQCPVEPKAVNWPRGDKKQKPSYRYKNCIRCYCCQEICPEKAISIQVPLLGKLIYR